MPCVAADDDCRMTSDSSSTTCDNHSGARPVSDDRLTPFALLPSVTAASTSSPSSTCSSPCRRLPMWRSLSSLWKRSSSSAVRQPTTAGAPADDAASETQTCNFSSSSTASQFFKEERTDDAVYSVYLKKVQYSTGDLDSHDELVDETDEVSESGETAFPTSECHQGVDANDDRRARLQWRLEEVRVIKYGTLGRLVAALSDDSGQMDVSNVNTFLTTCRTFASTGEVVDELIKRYNDVGADQSMKQEVKDGHRSTIRSVISAWLDAYPDDFRDPPQHSALRRLRQFAAGQLPDSDLHRRVAARLATLHRQETVQRRPQSAGAQRQPAVAAAASLIEIVLDDTSTASSRYLQRRQDIDVSNYSRGNKPVNLLSINSRHIAEQLTCTDADLFRKVLPQQCLGSVWSRRASASSRQTGRLGQSPTGRPGQSPGCCSDGTVASVSATVDQFNAVTHRVIASVVSNTPSSASASPSLSSSSSAAESSTSLSISQRARVVEKWIDVAQECRRLKNFSSLKAIISGLQCTAVYRLTRVWNAVSRQKLELFEELSAIFSEANNLQTWRDILSKEGTAKFASDTRTANTLQPVRKKSWVWSAGRPRRSQSVGSACAPVAQGTVPYLGTFLTDLMMIDAAFRDTTDSGLINFDKRRREFEVLTQIKLFQSAASMYHILRDRHFAEWFNQLETFDDNESYERSCIIEPDVTTESTPPTKLRHKKFSFSYLSPRRQSSYASISGFGSFDDLGSTSSSSGCSGIGGCGGIASRFATLRASRRKDGQDALSVKDVHSLTPEARRHMLALRHSVSAGSLLAPPAVRCCNNGSSYDVINGTPSSSTSSSAQQLQSTRDHLIVKVFLQTDDTHETVNYKSILLANSDHTDTVLRTAFVKYDVIANPDDYAIFQTLPDGSELALPERGNVFYAVNTSVPELQFVVRRKQRQLAVSAHHRPATSTNLWKRLSSFT